MQSLLSKEKQNVSLLHHQVNDLLSKHSEDSTVRDNFIKRLNAELDSKANVIVLLTQQIYRVRIKLKQELESKATKALVCSCPHCCVHSKILESKTQQGRALCFRKNKLRKADHHHLHDVEDQDSLSRTSSLVSGLQTRHFNPTPPLSPPPSSATGWWHGIVRRASTPVRRNSSSPTDSHTILSYSQMGMVQDDHTHHIHRTRRHTQSQSIWDSGGGVGSRRTPSYYELQQLLRLKYLEGENRVIRTKLIPRDSPAILPPIITSPVHNAEYLEEDHCGSDNGSAMLSHVHCEDLDMVADSSLLQHRHIGSYRSPGLSSAPPSSLCVLSQAGRCQSRVARGVVSKEAPGCGQEGT